MFEKIFKAEILRIYVFHWYKWSKFDDQYDNPLMHLAGMTPL